MRSTVSNHVDSSVTAVPHLDYDSRTAPSFAFDDQPMAFLREPGPSPTLVSDRPQRDTLSIMTKSLHVMLRR
jgi:hypothetical protein